MRPTPRRRQQERRPYQERRVLAERAIIKYLQEPISADITALIDLWTYQQEFCAARVIGRGLEGVRHTGREVPKVSGALNRTGRELCGF